MSVFERVNYNFDSNKFGDAQYLPEETIKGLKLTTKEDLFTWQKERLAEGTPILISEYRRNPLANLCNSILAQAESIIAVTEQPPADWTTWVSGTVNPSYLLTAAEGIRDEIKLFTDHTCNISGVSTIHVTVESPEPNIPTYETATMMGRQALEIFYQTDQIANAIPILGSFTSLYIKEELEKANANLTTSYVNGIITNPAGTDTQVITGTTSNLNSLLTLIQTRRLHDWQFFSNTKFIVDDYLLLKSLETGGKSNTEYNLTNNFVGTEKYKQNMLSQREEENEREYNEEYVQSSTFGGGTAPEEPPSVVGVDTETCTIPEQPPQFTFNFIDSTTPPGGGGGGSGVTCVTKPAILWNFNYNINTAPSPEPNLVPSRWVPVGSKNSVFSVRIPPANQFRQLFNTEKNPAQISFSFTQRAGRKIPSGRVFFSQCAGDFDTPLPGNTKAKCGGELREYSSFSIVNSQNMASWNWSVRWVPEKEFYLNFQFFDPDPESSVGDDNLGLFLDLNLTAVDGGSLGSVSPGGGGGGTTVTDFSGGFTRVDSIMNISIPSVPAGTDAYAFYQSLLPNTWGTSAQDSYNREMSLGISAIWSAYWNALPPHMKAYVTAPATGVSDPTWVYKANQNALSWIQFNGKNPWA